MLGRRWPLARVVLVAAQVQGDSAPGSLVSAFRRLEAHMARLAAEGRSDQAPTVTIIARGGGSLEDLWAFNDERVVRAVVAHPVPVISGVGHEADVTLVDFAADVRAPTPSAAAEIVVPGPDRVPRQPGRRSPAPGCGGCSPPDRRRPAASPPNGGRSSGPIPVAGLATSRERVGLLLDRATRAVAGRLAGERGRLGRAAVVHELAARRAATARTELATAGAALAVLGPQATLERGYAIVRRADDGAIVRDPAEAPPRTRLDVRVARGALPATVDEPRDP